MKLSTRIVGFLLLGIFLQACTPTHQPSTPKRTPDFRDIVDSAPDQPVDTSHVPDAVPRYELRTIAGNKNPYTVLGKTYYLIDDESSYKERGQASWYGKKFHGRKTSNGEIYDMYAMTAAHKTLPIPSYVRVTNVNNGKTVVVRVNDRGPFHSGRIIDLSYAAAQRLNILGAGTGLVDVEIIVPSDAPTPPLKANSSNQVAYENQLPPKTHLQIGAFSNESSAKQYAAQIGAKLGYPVVISRADINKAIYRVRVGPIANAQNLQNARHQLQRLGVPEAHVVYED